MSSRPRRTSLLLLLATLPALVAPAVAADYRGRIELAVDLDPRPLEALDGDAVVVPVFEGESTAAAVGQRLAAATVLDELDLLRSSLYASRLLVPAGELPARSIWLLRAGAEEELDGEALRRLAGAAAQDLRGTGVDGMTFLVRGPLPAAEAAAAVVEGTAIGLFDAGLHKTGDRPAAPSRLRIAGVGDGAEIEEAAARALVRARAVNFARSLGLEPGNFVYPEVLAEHARAIARESGLEVEVLDEVELRERGFGGVWAVGKGGANPPRVIALRYRAPRPSGVTLALVGKGVCFDSGGLSIKTYKGVYKMKNDLGGGAAVLAAMRIVASERPDVNVIGIVPAVENMPDGAAQRQGDVFTGFSGKTVEVMSTDAEGRLIVSDALAWAVELGATHLVDAATLTGTVIRALGDHRSGGFSNDDALWSALETAAERTGERFWRLPIDEEHGRGLEDSLVADLNETGGKAGASIGARFLREFVSGRPWIHLDIAGSSWPDKEVAYRDEGPTGATARTLAELAHVLAEAAPR